MSTPICAVLGHKPTRFKFKYKENYKLCVKLKKQMQEQFQALYEEGIHCFWVSGTLGVGIWAGEILLRMKEQPEFQALELTVLRPYLGHDREWDDRSRRRLQFLFQHSQGQPAIVSAPAPNAFKQLGFYMVDNADYLLAVYDDDSAKQDQLWETVDYARRRGRNIILLDPDTAAVKGTSSRTQR